MKQGEHYEGPAQKLEGPFYQDGHWAASITLRGIESKTFYGSTEKEVQAQMLEYLDQIVRELEKAHTLKNHNFLRHPSTDDPRFFRTASNTTVPLVQGYLQ